MGTGSVPDCARQAAVESKGQAVRDGFREGGKGRSPAGMALWERRSAGRAGKDPACGVVGGCV